MAENKIEAKLERIYTVPLGDAYEYIRTRRTERAVKLLRQFLVRHMKAKEVNISGALNSSLWERGIQKPPRRVKIRAVRENGIVKAYLSDEKIEIKVEKKPAKEEKPKETNRELGTRSRDLLVGQTEKESAPEQKKEETAKTPAPKEAKKEGKK